MDSSLHLVGYAYGQAAGDSGCVDGPDTFKKSCWFQRLIQEQENIVWDTTFYPESFSDKLIDTQAICQHLAEKTEKLTRAGQRFVTIGGDHSCAIGTWSGVYQALCSKGSLGLIWIDAHMDSHTPQTSHSDNIHGMPLAVLLGHGNPGLTGLMQAAPKCLPEQVCLIGVRSFESEEATLLKRLGVRVFYQEEIVQRGLAAVFNEALVLVQKNTVGFGISIDLDALDPKEVPGVGTPEPLGSSVSAMYESLLSIRNNPYFLGGEIAEFNPHHDVKHKTEEVVYRLISAMTK